MLAFTAFCLNMREIALRPSAIIRTPVFLDATCSGIQHLSALMLDLELGTKVNLSQSEIPEDFYNEIVGPVNKAINKYGEDNPEFAKLSFLKFNRSILKQSIMTKVYNVSQFGIAEQIKSKLDQTYPVNPASLIEEEMATGLTKSLSKTKAFKTFRAPGHDGKMHSITSSDIMQIAKIINEQIFVLFPSLNNIYSYFINMSKLLSKFGLPVIWFTPNGIQITQHYLKTKQNTINLSIFGKTKKIILRETMETMDKGKQTQAIIPNIIHSLDATHLMSIINSANSLGFKPVLTIHDCFGTLPNKMADLELSVKKEFIETYKNEDFLNKFHDRILQTLEDNQFLVKGNKVKNINGK